MKTRSDFVSNSSSSSFVLRGENAAKGIRLFRRLLEKHGVPWKVEDEISVHVRALNKNMRKLREMLSRDEDRAYCMGFGRDVDRAPPDELSWDTIELRLNKSDLAALTDEALGRADSVEFHLSDSCGMRYMLKLMYLFFQRNGCSPDALDSEQDFMAADEEEEFMRALAAEPDEESEARNG